MIRKTRLKTNRRRSGFTITDMLAVTMAVVVVLATQLPADAAARRTARRMQNSTQLRGIHQALVTHANSNKDNFAGLDSKGDIVADTDKTTGSSGAGDTVQARFWILLDGDFFTPEYAISPSEVANITDYDPGQAAVAAPVQWNERVKHYSYAMLGIRGDKLNPTKPAEDARGRHAEWSQTLNSQSIVISDRNSGDDAMDNVGSIHTDGQGDWTGSVLWNDNHVGFEDWHAGFATKYGNGELNADDFNDGLDNLFEDQKIGKNAAGFDALMIIADNDTVHAGE